MSECIVFKWKLFIYDGELFSIDAEFVLFIYQIKLTQLWPKLIYNCWNL